MPIDINLLKEIAEVAGAPGHEQRVREIVLREVTPLVDEIKIDNMGNVYAIKK
jgi:endoglucanase